MNTDAGDRLWIGILCTSGMIGMVLLALTNHVEAAITVPPAVAALAAIIRNNAKVTDVANQVADVGSKVADLTNGELTARIKAGFVQAMNETGHNIVDAEPAGQLDAHGQPYQRRQGDASSQPIR